MSGTRARPELRFIDMNARTQIHLSSFMYKISNKLAEMHDSDPEFNVNYVTIVKV